MKTLRPGFHFFALALILLIAFPAFAALYEDDAKNAKTGDIADQDYWFTKFDMMMLDLAIKQRQPEGRIGVDLAGTANRLNDLIKKYPNHEELPKWKAHVDGVLKKIDPNAQRNVYFNANCPWDEANFAQLWVNFHYAKMLLDAKDYEKAFTMLTNVMSNYDIMLKLDRMKDYPEDLRKWVQDNKPEADKMFALAKEKTNRH